MLVVDTYNVLHVTGVLPTHLSGMGVPELIRLLSVSRHASRRITLVCDGGPGRGALGVRMDGVRVLYAGPGLEADDLIEVLIDRYHRGNPLEVVSSDRRLQRAARRRGAGVISSDRFLADLLADQRRPRRRFDHHLRRQVPLDRYSVQEWCAEFGVGYQSPASSGSGGRPAPRPGPGQARAANRRSPPTTGLGESLRVPAVPDGDGGSAANPVAGPAGGSGAKGGSGQAGPSGVSPPGAEIDPLIRAALEEWGERLTLDDLDMRRWVPDAERT